MEDLLKKKLQNFIAEMFKMGTVKGFKLFGMYIRGKEELIISVLNEPLELQHECSAGGTPLGLSDASQLSWANSTSFNSANLPYDKRSLMISQRSQKLLSGFASIGVGLPPASPSEKETMETDENSTLFLLACYARYNCPYVWVRSNHRRLINLLGDNDKDNPLNLKASNKWLEQDIKPWDLIGEVVKLNTYPPPRNPFEVDLEYFESLPEEDKLSATGAMMYFLQKILYRDREDRYYTAKVLEDLERLTEIHFQHLVKVTGKNSGPLSHYLPRSVPSSQFSGAGGICHILTEKSTERRRRASSTSSGGANRYPASAYQAYS